MGLLKNRAFYSGLLTGLLWTAFGVIIVTYFMSQHSLEQSLKYLYKKNQLGGLLSIGALINLPIFFLAIRKNKMLFASGIVVFSLLMVLVVAVLKISA